MRGQRKQNWRSLLRVALARMSTDEYGRPLPPPAQQEKAKPVDELPKQKIVKKEGKQRSRSLLRPRLTCNGAGLLKYYCLTKKHILKRHCVLEGKQHTGSGDYSDAFSHGRACRVCGTRWTRQCIERAARCSVVFGGWDCVLYARALTPNSQSGKPHPTPPVFQLYVSVLTHVVLGH